MPEVPAGFSRPQALDISASEVRVAATDSRSVQVLQEPAQASATRAFVVESGGSRASSWRGPILVAKFGVVASLSLALRADVLGTKPIASREAPAGPSAAPSHPMIPAAAVLPQRPAAPSPVSPPQLSVSSSSGDDTARQVEASLVQAIDQAERGDLEQARMAYDDALRFAAGDASLFERYDPLKQRFTSALADAARFELVRDAFAQSDFRGALTLLYRLPTSFPLARKQRATANGWYDLAVVALRAGRCAEAREDLDEAERAGVAMTTSDSARSLVARCDAEFPSVRFVAACETIGFRGIDD